MKKMKNLNKKIIIKMLLVFTCSFLILSGVVHLQFNNVRTSEQLKAAYTAESTVEGIEAQLNKYFSKSDLLKRIVEAGHELDDEEFYTLSSYMQNDENIIEGIELAKDGVVSQVYPYESNRQALGLDMLNNSARKTEARLSVSSRKYTIAGPYELVQGGMGALLFDPIYTSDSYGNQSFWGFSILVINWDNFIKSIQLDTLEKARYDYRIWKYDMGTDDKIILAQSTEKTSDDVLEVVCEVPNDNWHFEIMPIGGGGWVSKADIFYAALFVIIISGLVTALFWQFEVRRYRESVYTANIEKAARQAKSANEAKTRFLFNMSHDIRTPLNAIIGYSQLLKEHSDDESKVGEYIDKIQASGSVLLSIINHVLEMARIESGKITLNENSASLSKIVKSLEDVFEPTVKEKGLTCSFTCTIEHDNVVCDETKVKEILLNIVGNSVKYTPCGVQVRMNMSEKECDTEGYASYCIEISDTGIGMSKEYLPHIFEEFTREHSSTEGKVDGTGLGLPIVKALLDQMNGNITVSSEPGNGTTTIITIAFPIAVEIMKESEVQPDREAFRNRLKGKRLLLAEDNDLNAEIAMTILRENGIEVERACDGKICVDMVEAADEDYYDGILMDIQMPDMNGYEATDAIRKMKGKRGIIPIIAMTVNAFEEDKKKAFISGMNAHLAKPINIDTMMDTLGRYIV